MSDYLNLFDKLLKNFLDDDFVENATKFFNEQKQECKCDKEKKVVCNENEKGNCGNACKNTENNTKGTCTSTFVTTPVVRSEVLKQTDKGVVFKTFLPGVERENISINVKNNVMEIKLQNVFGKGKHPDLLDLGYSKKIALADGVFDYNNIVARYEENILYVFIPRKVEKDKCFEIKIN